MEHPEKNNAIEEKITADKLLASTLKKQKKEKRKLKKKIRKLKSMNWDLQEQLDDNAEKIRSYKKKAKKYKKKLRMLLYHYGDNPFLDLNNLPSGKTSSNMPNLFDLSRKKNKSFIEGIYREV